jgi:hypothetical protein
MSYPPGPPDDDATPENPYQGPGGQPGSGPAPGYGQPGSGPGQPGYGQPGYPPGYGGYGYQQPPRTNSKATASLVTGITTLVLSWCCGLGLAGIVAIVLGAKARNEIKAGGGSQTGDGMALAGIITGAVAAVLGLVFLVLVVVAIATGNTAYNLEPYDGGY